MSNSYLSLTFRIQMVGAIIERITSARYPICDKEEIVVLLLDDAKTTMALIERRSFGRLVNFANIQIVLSERKNLMAGQIKRAGAARYIASLIQT